MSTGTDFCIKKGYQANMTPEYYLDTPSELTYQPDVYELAAFLAERGEIRTILDIGSGNGLKLARFGGQYEIVAVDFGGNRQIIAANAPQAKFVEANLEQGLPVFAGVDLAHTLVIISDVIEHLVNPAPLLRDLAGMVQTVPWLLLSTPDRQRCRGCGDLGPPTNRCHVREWTLEELDCLLRQSEVSPFMIGYTVNTDRHLQKTGILVVAGTGVYQSGSPDLRILAIVNLYNEADILPEVVQHLLVQGVDVQLVDNWSTDGSWDLARRMADANPKRVMALRFPDQPSQFYEWGAMLERTAAVAAASDYDWILHYDADELRESPWPGVTLAQALAFVDARGFNAVDFTVLDFRPTQPDPQPQGSIRERLPFFEFGRRPGHFQQIKAWKNQAGLPVELAASGGHQAEFAGRKIFPLKFLNCHFPLRSQQQARQKVFNDRLSRFSPGEKQGKGWHSQYDRYDKACEFVWEKRDVDDSFHPQWFAAEYLVERISGIGIVRR